MRLRLDALEADCIEHALFDYIAGLPSEDAIRRTSILAFDRGNGLVEYTHIQRQVATELLNKIRGNRSDYD